MNSTPSPLPPSRRRRTWLWIGVTALSLGLASILGIASIFLLNSDARALREEMGGPQGSSSLRTKIQLSLGPVSTGLARFVIGHVDGVDEEARTALASLRSVSLGLYEVDDPKSPMPILADIDARMLKRGWQRMVTVRDRDQSVFIFGPVSASRSRVLPLCIAVRDGKQLIVISLRADPEPLLKLAQRELALKHQSI